MRAIASIPRSGREPCAARPAVSSSNPTKPLCAIATLSSVGSGTIAPSTWRPDATHRLRSGRGGLLVHDGGQRRRRRQGRARRPPRPSRPPAPPSCRTRRVRRGGRSRVAARGVAPCRRRRRCRCARSRSSVRPPPLPRATPITFGRPGATSSRGPRALPARATRRRTRDRRLARAARHQRRIDRVDRDEAPEQLRKLGHGELPPVLPRSTERCRWRSVIIAWYARPRVLSRRSRVLGGRDRSLRHCPSSGETVTRAPGARSRQPRRLERASRSAGLAGSHPSPRARCSPSVHMLITRTTRSSNLRPPARRSLAARTVRSPARPFGSGVAPRSGPWSRVSLGVHPTCVRRR